MRSKEALDEIRKAFVKDDSIELTRQEREDAPDYLVDDWADAVQWDSDWYHPSGRRMRYDERF